MDPEASVEAPSDIERRTVSDGSVLERDRDRNTLAARGSAATVLLACARHVARLEPERALGWWRGEAQTGDPGLDSGPDDRVELRGHGASARVALSILRWAIEAAYAEHLGDFARWLFDPRPRACVAGEGDHEVARSLETPLAKLAADVAAKSLPPATETARRQALLAQISSFGLLSEPMLEAKRDALRAFDCPALARWADAAIALGAYFTSPERARVLADYLGPADVLTGVFSLDFPSVSLPPEGASLHGWWAFCESALVRAQRKQLPDSGFIISSAGRICAQIYFRIEDGKRRVVYAVKGGAAPVPVRS